MKAIETYYNGYRFRSRLEARWAVFFDAAEIKYEYEPEGFELDSGALYLPDFYLPDYKCFVEVKPLDAFNIEYDCTKDTVCFEDGYEVYGQAAYDITHKLKRNYAIVFGDPLDVFQLKHSSHLFTLSECVYHVMQRGDHEHEYVCKTGESCRECNHYNVMVSGLWCGIATFHGHDFIIQSSPEKFIPNIDDGIISLEMFLNFQPNDGERFTLKDLVPFAERARQARFEHGEYPHRHKITSINSMNVGNING